MESLFLRFSVLTPDSTSLIKQRTILGIDPGTNILGFGIISVNAAGKPEFLDMGVVDLRKEQDAYSKLAAISAKVGSLCDQYRPDDLAIESPFYAKNAQVIFKLGRAQGAAIVAASQRGIPVTEYAPRKAKIAICGNGAASKEQVAMIVEKTLGIDIQPSFLDATDALAIALCHYYQISSPLAGAGSSSGSWEKFLATNPDRIKK